MTVSHILFLQNSIYQRVYLFIHQNFHQIDYTYALYICVDSMIVAILKAFSRGEIQKVNNSQ